MFIRTLLFGNKDNNEPQTKEQTTQLLEKKLPVRPHLKTNEPAFSLLEIDQVDNPQQAKRSFPIPERSEQHPQDANKLASSAPPPLKPVPVPSPESLVPQAFRTPPSPPVPSPASPVKAIGRWAQLQQRRAHPHSFLWEARQRVDQTRSAATHVPLLTYWVTYGALDPQQLDWYYFWRTRYRAGEALKTDLSYLYLHIYELLHGIGCDSPTEAFASLHHLWQTYRATYPKLDNHLIDWLNDFIQYYALDDEQAHAWLNDRWRYSRGELAIHDWIKGGFPTPIPATVLRQLITYQPEQNKFYRANQDRTALDTLLNRAIILTNDFYTQTYGHSVFEHFKPQKKNFIVRLAFDKAIFEGHAWRYRVATVHAYALDGTLSPLLTQAVRYAENIARKHAGFRPALRDVTLPADLAAYLDVHFTPHGSASGPEKRQPDPVIQLDLQRLAVLQQESEAIRKRLLEDGEEARTPIVNQPRPPEVPQLIPSYSRTNEQTNAGFLQLLSKSARDLLLKIQHQEWQVAEHELALPPGVFASGLIDEINEAAQLHFGDILLIQEDEQLMVLEEYRPEVAHLLSSPPTLSGDWRVFAELLLPLHAEVLAYLLPSGRTLSEIEALTAVHQAFASAVLEDLNAHALDTLGDILIDPYQNPLVIEDAYRDDLRHVLTLKGLILGTP